jgi:hypothetical protein
VTRYTPTTIDDVKICVADCSDDMKVEVQSGVPLVAMTVADLRSLPAWPPRLILDVHKDPDPRFSVVKVERA